MKGVDGCLKEPKLLHDAAHGIINAGTAYARGNLQGVLTAGIELVKEVTSTPQKRQNYRKTMTSPSDVIQLSGCKDYQTSADTMEGVKSTETK